MFSFGSGVLYGLRNDIANQTPMRFGTMNDVSIDITSDLKELYGQSQFPVAIGRGKSKVTGKAKFGTISGQLFNNIFFGSTATVGDVLWSYQEAGTVPALTTYTVTVTNGATFDTDLGVYYTTTGVQLTKVAAGSEAAGKYSVSAVGVYTFAAADASKAVIIDYTYTGASAGVTVSPGNPLMGSAPTFMAVFVNKFQTQTVMLKLYSCVANKLTMATKLDDFTVPEIDFQAFANAAGQTLTLTVSDN